MQKQPRPHHETIIAWANGAKIRYRAPGASKWIYTQDPAWIEDYEYEVVPEREYPETKMTPDELCRVSSEAAHCAEDFRNLGDVVRYALVNAALRHAIDNGQVVTREEFDKVTAELKGARTNTLVSVKEMNDELHRDARDMAIAEAVRRACVLMFRVTGWPDVQNMELSNIIKAVE